MEITLNEPTKPLGSDDLVFTVRSIDRSQRIGFGDIVEIFYENETTNESSHCTIYVSQSDESDESPFTLIRLLIQSVGYISTIDVSTNGRFIGIQDSNMNHLLKVSFTSIALSAQTATDENLVTHAETRRLSGNTNYGHKSYDSAVKLYNTAIALCESRKNTPELLAPTDTLLKCQNNLAACYMQLEKFEKAIEILEKVEQADPLNTKMMWRMGRCLLKLEKFEKSKIYLAKAKELDYDSKIITKDLQIVNKKLEELENQSRKMAEKIFSGLQKEAESRPDENVKPVIKREDPEKIQSRLVKA